MTQDTQAPLADTIEGEYETRVVPTHSSQMAFMAAEIDVQVATAKKFPRSIAEFKRKALSLATISQEVAEGCQYALPRAGEIITGPSVRLAEIIAISYGNIRLGGRVVSNDGRRVTAQGICYDVENNVAITIEVSRSIMQNVYEYVGGKKKRTGKMTPMNDDLQTLIGNAATAIAIRNALFRVVPKAAWNEVYAEVQKVAKGSAETLAPRRQKAVDFFKSKGVAEADIYRVLEVKGIDDIDLDKLAVLSAMKAALVNKEASLENLFPPLNAKQKADAATKATEDKLNRSGNGAKDTAGQMEKGIDQQQTPAT